MKDLRRVAGSDPRFPQVVFVFMGDADEGEAFLRPLWAEAVGIADPDKALYDDFGVGRGGVREMFGPGAVVCGIRATIKGSFIGRKHGDPWTLPVFVLADRDRIRWRFEGEHAGDHPDWEQMLREVPV